MNTNFNDSDCDMDDSKNSHKGGKLKRKREKYEFNNRSQTVSRKRPAYNSINTLSENSETDDSDSDRDSSKDFIAQNVHTTAAISKTQQYLFRNYGSSNNVEQIEYEDQQDAGSSYNNINTSINANVQTDDSEPEFDQDYSKGFHIENVDTESDVITQQNLLSDYDSPTNIEEGMGYKDKQDAESNAKLQHSFTHTSMLEEQKYRETMTADKKINSTVIKSKNINDNVPFIATPQDAEGKAEILGKSNDSSFVGNNKSLHMMMKMGYTEGKGLGKHKQGRVEPVEASKQHGRRGFGLRISDLERASLKWNPQEEVITVCEQVEWLENTYDKLPQPEDLYEWCKTQLGPKKTTLDDEMNFCDPDILEQVISSKTVFDQLDKNEMRNARSRANPFETIRGAFFLNRAAVKMANIDAACIKMFTSPKNIDKNKLLYFADVCAGPGGFSEYVLWRTKWHAKGFGFTLKNDNDFKLCDFYAGNCETFHPFYGPKQNGDVYDPENQNAFKDLIMTHTHGKGVHFMMSDGGFSVEGQETMQEVLSKQLYLCQCLVALMIVRTGGHFVTKLFDLFTPFSVGLVYLMFRCFDKVCIFKPNSSRPANSERYLICKRKRSDTEAIMQYLYDVNLVLLRIQKDKKTDVVQLVPLEILEGDQKFIEYIRYSNNYLGKKQIIALLKIAAFCEQRTLVESKQVEMRTQCLKLWDVPDQSRTAPFKSEPRDRLKHLLNDQSANFLSSMPDKLTMDNIESSILKEPLNWYYMACGSRECVDPNKMATFYMGMGRQRIYRYSNGSWILLHETKLDLPPDTLIYAEMIYEIIKERKYQRKTPALHILDSFVLGGENISQKYITERHELTKKFCEALWKPSPTDYVRIRVKELHRLDPTIDLVLKEVWRVMKNGDQVLAYEFARSYLDDDVDDKNPSFFVLNSIVFLNSIKPPWNRFYSKTQRLTYVHNRMTNETKFDVERPSLAEADFVTTFSKRILWHWPLDKSVDKQILVKRIKEILPEMCEYAR